MKKVFPLLLTSLLLFTLSACSRTEPALTQLGSSKLYIALPDGYAETEDDFSEDQVAYFYKDDDSIDFDVYQWEKGNGYTLESEAAYFAGEYGTTASAVTVNGLSAMKYISCEEYDGYEYTVVNYMFDDGDDLVELCFWTINTEEELSAVEEIINTITMA